MSLPLWLGLILTGALVIALTEIRLQFLESSKVPMTSLSVIT